MQPHNQTDSITMYLNDYFNIITLAKHEY